MQHVWTMVSMTDNLIMSSSVYIILQTSFPLVGKFNRDTVPLITICSLAGICAGCLQSFILRLYVLEFFWIYGMFGDALWNDMHIKLVISGI